MFIDTSTSMCVEILTISSTGVDAMMFFGLMLSARGHCLGLDNGVFAQKELNQYHVQKML